MKTTKKQQELHAKILDKLYTMGPISRIDISKQTGITPATVTEITGQLLNEALIQEEGIAQTGANKSGRKKILLDVAPNQRFVIGAELSEKYISFCLTDNLGHIIDQKIINFKNWQASEQLTEREFIDELQQMLITHSEYPITAIGIALPGHFDENHQTIVSNHPFWRNFNLALIQQSFELPVYFKNNVECMTITQRLLSHQQTDENFIFFHVARGMFCSYMYQGKIYGQHNFDVGEIGFMIVQSDSDLYGTGDHGYLQSYASETSIIEKAKILFDHNKTTYLHQLVNEKEDIQINEILQAYELGDEGIINILNHAIKYLAIALKNLSTLIDSQVLYIHGEIFSNETLFRLLNEQIHQSAGSWWAEKKQRVLLSPYHATDGARAACGLAIYNTLLTPTH